MPDVETIEKPRVRTIKGTSKIPPDELYYGEKVDFDLIEVKQRRTRLASGGKEKFEDFIIFYEKLEKIEGEMERVCYYITPPPPDLFPEYFYPAAQWNISQSLLDEQDYIPDWQRRFVLGGNGNPVYIAGRPLKAFHYIVVNRRFAPEQNPDGSDNDGLFVEHPLVSGEAILRREEAKQELGGDMLGMTRRRVDDGPDEA